MTSSSTPKNFLGLPPEFCSFEKSQHVFLPLPFDKACSWMRGASKGPEAVIDASTQLELFDIETRSEPYKMGFFTAPPVDADDSETMVKRGYSEVKRLLDANKFVMTIGGDHSISHGPIKAHVEKFPKMSILHLDAHTDRRQSYEGSIYSHASIIARAQEMVPNIISVGIRSMDISEMKGLREDHVFFAERLKDPTRWIPEVLGKLSEQVYITLDVDVFDIGIMPSTGTPEPGGLGWYEVMSLIRHVATNRTLVGMDVVELLPNEHNRAPDFLVAKLLYKTAAYRQLGK